MASSPNTGALSQNERTQTRNTCHNAHQLQVMLSFWCVYWGCVQNLTSLSPHADCSNQSHTQCLLWDANPPFLALAFVLNAHFLLTCPLCWSPGPPPLKLPLVIPLWASGSPAAGRPFSYGCPPAQSAPLGSGLLGLQRTRRQITLILLLLHIQKVGHTTSNRPPGNPLIRHWANI